MLPAQAPKTRAFGLFKLLLALGIGIASLSVNVSLGADPVPGQQDSELSAASFLSFAFHS